MGITRQQLALIHVAKTALKLKDDPYRDLLQAQFGVRSAKNLTPSQVDPLLRIFRDLGWKQRRAPRRRPNALDLASPAHLALLAKFYDGLKWEPARRVGFNRKMTGRPWPQSRADCNKIIEALKAMAKRNYAERTTPTTEEGA